MRLLQFCVPVAFLDLSKNSLKKKKVIARIFKLSYLKFPSRKKEIKMKICNYKKAFSYFHIFEQFQIFTNVSITE